MNYSILNNLMISICIVDSKGNVIFSNDSFDRFFGEVENIFTIISDNYNLIIKDVLKKSYPIFLKSSKNNKIFPDVKDYFYMNIKPFDEEDYFMLEIHQNIPELIRKDLLNNDIKSIKDEIETRQYLFNSLEFMLLEKQKPWDFIISTAERIYSLNILKYLKVQKGDKLIVYGENNKKEIESNFTINMVDDDINFNYVSNSSTSMEVKLMLLTYLNFVKLYVTFYSEFEKSKMYDVNLLDSEKFSMAGQMMIGMLHEINNPLAVAMLQSDILISKKVDYVERIINIKSSLMRIKEITEIFRGALKQNATITTFGLKKLINTAIDFINPKKPSNVSIIIDLNYEDYDIQGDFNKLVLVFVNLISNAIDAINRTRKNKGWVKITTFEFRDKLIVKVSDNGEGMDEKILKNIFKPFYTTKTKSGLGYGLFFVSTVCSSHNIKLSVISKRNSGTTFTLVIPKFQAEGSI
ncbi:PAS domain-containing sensor histidine kinase [Oceanotoga teriensis]|uniref:PAS domain-containing sensor histidine kinase n=1 Tax=Oceanotoga teriensis TaxID=515440 RepID=UPI002712D190|nr:PAS domain-containing sensor histidine kinase [Oceanotoga teriensis]MDO7975742.1 PAS domain-containing sensor histidine kinase [Oceanotoga teriensis]